METESTAGTYSTERSAAQNGFMIFQCFMLSKSGGLQRYQLEISATEVRVVSSSSGSVKFSLSLDSLQVKTMNPQPKERSGSAMSDDSDDKDAV